MNLLVSHGLSVSIAGIEICRDLAIEIPAASRWAILGRNGIGKTTLLKALAGLHPVDRGTIEIEGAPLDRMPRRELARKIGMLFQEQETLFPGTVLETALIGRHPHLDSWGWEGAEDAALASAALAEVGLEGMEHRGLETLSGGERQRLAVAALISQDPALYLLDEPSNHLDPHHQIHILETLCRRMTAAGSRSMIMVLHDVNLALRFCDHALLLFGKGVSEHGRTREVVNPQSLERLYGHPVITAVAGHEVFYFPE